VGAEEVPQVGQLRVGLDQVLVVTAGTRVAGQDLYTDYGEGDGVCRAAAGGLAALEIPGTPLGRGNALGRLIGIDCYCVANQGIDACRPMGASSGAIRPTLPAQAEQTMLALRQAEARQAQWIDLLLAQI